MDEKNKESLFIERIKEEALIDNWDRISEYLISGLAENRNYGGLLTPQVFYKYFYVASANKERYKILHDKLKKLYESRNKNTLIVTAHGGSGKSIFVHLIPQLISSEKHLQEFADVKIIDVDFESQWSNWWEKLLNAFYSFIENDLKEHPLKSINAFKNLYLKCIDRIYNQGTVANTPDASFLANVNSILKKIKDSINSNYVICNNIHNIFNTTIVGDVTSTKGKESACVSAIILAFILFLICKDALEEGAESDFKQFIKTIPSLQKKYLIVFDNLEVFDNGSLQEIAVVIKQANCLIRERLLRLDNSSNLSDYFYRYYICVCAMRTSTFNLVYESLHDGSNTLGHFYEHLELEYNNIFQEAILKKIGFLYYLGLQNSPFVKKLESVTKFLFNKSTLDKLNSKNGIATDLQIDTALKIYIENNFVAFFNNDIRRATNNIINIFNQNKNSTKIRELLNSKTREDLNGARQAIFRGLFDEISEHTFAQFGFEPIDPKHGCEKCSATRILLAYLKWNELCENNQLSLQKALEHINELHLYDDDQIANWIYTISNVVAKTDDNLKVIKDYKHYELISQKWSSLIGFSENLTKEELINGIKQYFYMPNSTVTINKHNIKSIKLHLTPAGQSVIYNVASQYEFFASRIDTQYKPLYCYDDIYLARPQLFDNLEDVFQAINRYITGMILRCPCQKNDATYNGECNYNEINKSAKKILQCGYFIRLQEILNILKTTIDYLDRYRLYIKKKKKMIYETDYKLFEKDILLNIKKYSDIYSEIQNGMGRFKTCTFINNLHLDTKNKQLHKVYKALKTKSGNQAVQSLYYFAFELENGEKIDLLKTALDLTLKRAGYDNYNSSTNELYNKLFIDDNSDNLSLYKLCQKIASSNSTIK